MKFRYVTHLSWMILAGCIAFVHSALGQTRVGLHFTQEELNIWRQRATSGPYRVAGDVSTNSPGDWTRIVSNRNAFTSNPSNGRWSAPATSGGCVQANESTYSWPEPGGSVGWSIRLRDAAFHNLVMGVTTDRAAIKQELLWLATQTWAQFGNANGIWCFEQFVPFDSAPSFGITSILTRILFAYDYVGRSAFTQSELDTMDRWFFDAADYWRRDMEVGLDGVFVNRDGGDYTKAGETCSDPQPAYVTTGGNGPTISSYGRFYNNRRGSNMRFPALVAVYLTKAGRNYTNGRYESLVQMYNDSKRYVQEWIRFSVFPQGFVGDFERREDFLPDLGWAYSGPTVAQIMTIADAFARAGDTSLYTYSTALGDCGTVGTINDGGSRNGQNRDLLFVLQSYMKYPTDQYARFWPTAIADNRIDGRNPRNGSDWNSIADLMPIMGNVFYKDAFVKQAYTRTHPNSIPYPASPAFGSHPMGENMIFPGMLFMFGQMEGVVDPYSSGQAGGGGGGTTPSPSCSSVGLNNFVGCYYDDIGFTALILNRTDAVIDFNWGEGSPDPQLGPDNFSVKWEGDFDFPESGTYRFSVSTDDGMRLYVGGALIIDAWLEQPPTTYTADLNLTSGRHRIRVDYYENAGGATANASWALIGSPLPLAPGGLSVSVIP